MQQFYFNTNGTAVLHHQVHSVLGTPNCHSLSLLPYLVHLGAVHMVRRCVGVHTILLARWRIGGLLRFNSNRRLHVEKDLDDLQ